ncbi:MAG: protein kinase [Myxococcales bacterium]|nr:protein kinase [Polyangiaceae bacterium]MDW8247775.1 protein kinase [Myxococcales bacterium]
MELREGQVIEGLRGRFQIRRRCGEGGFGLTFEGVDAQERAVAIKQLRFEKLRDWKALELFEREGRVLEQLSHPNIPAYIDFFVHDGHRPLPPSQAAAAVSPVSWFLVQQFVQGPSLQQVMDGHRRLDGSQLTTILDSLLSTLDYLHQLNPPVIHRDINPKNIVLSPDGRPFLVDFGAIQDRLRFENQQGSTSVGTLGYMPLEQLRGVARPSSDLYALGMTILALASGRCPAEMPVDESTGKVVIEQVAPELPPQLRAVLDRMIEPIVGQRIASAAEALRLLREPVPTPRPHSAPPLFGAPPQPPPFQTSTLWASPSKILLIIGVAVSALVFSGGFVAFLTFRPVKRPPRILTIPAKEPASNIPPDTPTIPLIPTFPSPEKPYPTTTQSTPVSLTWKARVTSSTDKALALGSPCEVKLDVMVNNDEFTNPVLQAHCREKVLYDSRAPLNGTSMSSWEMSENPLSGKVGAFSYQLRYSDTGPRTGERAQAVLDTSERQGIFFREMLPLYRVTLAVDPDSANRMGEPFLKENQPPFRKVLQRKGKVVEVSGKSPVMVGALCQLILSPAKAIGSTCRAQLFCGGKTLYGALPSNGFAPCELEDGEPVRFFDPGSDKPNGDPETRLDLKAGQVELKDTRGGKFSMKVKLLSRRRTPTVLALHPEHGHLGRMIEGGRIHGGVSQLGHREAGTVHRNMEQLLDAQVPAGAEVLKHLVIRSSRKEERVVDRDEGPAIPHQRPRLVENPVSLSHQIDTPPGG